MVFKPGKDHPFFGKHRPKEVCDKISKSHMNIRPSEDSKKKNADAHRDKPLTTEHISHIKESMKGKNVGEKNPMFGKPAWNRGIPHLVGDTNPSWKGGVSFEPYCIKFNNEFKERVRAFFGHECVECHKTQDELGRKLDVHHVNYDKMMCCNDVKPLFVALCRGCNSKANYNRDYWQKHYTETINNKYNGVCYLPRGAISKCT